MASLNERLERLWGRIGPPAPIEPPPQMDRLLLAVSRARAALDLQDRGHNERLDLDASEATAEPEREPPLTLAEHRAEREESRRFLAYLENERDRLTPGSPTRDALERAVNMQRAAIDRAGKVITFMEPMEGDES